MIGVSFLHITALHLPVETLQFGCDLRTSLFRAAAAYVSLVNCRLSVMRWLQLRFDF